MDNPEPIDPNMYLNRTADAVQRNSGRVTDAGGAGRLERGSSGQRQGLRRRRPRPHRRPFQGRAAVGRARLNARTDHRQFRLDLVLGYRILDVTPAYRISFKEALHASDEVWFGRLQDHVEVV
jgi:hypothetical protein